MIGQKLLHYEISQKLGEGGMGVVYKARDTHLDRFVAIKVLPPGKVADLSRKARFVQEAKAASALNHPNIITIHDISSDAGIDFIVMEYVAGKTLDQSIPRGGMRLNDALKIGAQIAGALARAHTAGIVHRDLKPANVMLDDHGVVKVLDYGLAKLFDRDGPGDETATIGVDTDEGTIVGTAAYMSPEQAEGRAVDARSDIFSFGAVLYEMVTGRQAFGREGRISTLAAVVAEEPAPAGESGKPVSSQLERIIQRCLKKNPNERYQHAADLQIALEDLKADSDSGHLTGVGAAVPKRPARRLRLAMWGIAALLILGTGALWVWRTRPAVSPAGLPLVRLTSESGVASYPSLSADGKLLAFASDRVDGQLDVYIQQMSGGPPLRLTDHPANDSQPSLSPDGSRVAFWSGRDGGGIYDIPALGGSARLLVRRGHRPKYSPDGSRLLYKIGESASSFCCELYTMPAAGGTPVRIAPGRQAKAAEWMPDGKSVLLIGSDDTAYVAPSIGGQPRAIPSPKGPWAALWARDARIIDIGAILPGPRMLVSAGTAQAASLWLVPLEPKSLEVSGEPQRLTLGTGFDVQAAYAGRSVVFSSGPYAVDLWSIPLDVETGRLRGEPSVLTNSTQVYFWPHLARDGRTAIYGHWQGKSDPEIETRDLESGKTTVLAASGDFPKLSADGKWATYLKSSSLMVSQLGGTAEELCANCGYATSWSADGRWLSAGHVVAGGYEVLLINRETREKRVLVAATDAQLFQSQLSPNGQWLAFCRNRQGESKIFLAPLREAGPTPAGEWIPLASGGEHEDKPRWSPDSNLLYFVGILDGERCIWAQPIDRSTGRPHGAPIGIAHFHKARYSLVALRFFDMGVGAGRLLVNVWPVASNIWKLTLPEH